MIRRGFKLLLFASALGIGGMIAAAMFRETVDGLGQRRHRGARGRRGNRGVAVGDRQLDGPRRRCAQPERDGRRQHPALTRDRDRRQEAHDPYQVRLFHSAESPITFTLTIPKLEKLSVSGAGNATTEKLTGENLTVKLSGAGDATLRDLDLQDV